MSGSFIGRTPCEFAPLGRTPSILPRSAIRQLPRWACFLKGLSAALLDSPSGNYSGPHTGKSNDHTQRHVKDCRKRLPVLKETKRLEFKSGERRVSANEADGD